MQGGTAQVRNGRVVRLRQWWRGAQKTLAIPQGREYQLPISSSSFSRQRITNQ